MAKRQKGKGKKRKRGWHRSKRSEHVFYDKIRRLEKGERNG